MQCLFIQIFIIISLLWGKGTCCNKKLYHVCRFIVHRSWLTIVIFFIHSGGVVKIDGINIKGLFFSPSLWDWVNTILCWENPVAMNYISVPVEELEEGITRLSPPS